MRILGLVLSVVLLVFLGQPVQADSWKITHRENGNRRSVWTIDKSEKCVCGTACPCPAGVCKDGRCQKATSSTSTASVKVETVTPSTVSSSQVTTCENGQCSVSNGRRRRGR